MSEVTGFFPWWCVLYMEVPSQSNSGPAPAELTPIFPS